MIRGWSGEAFNQVPDATNEIHGDALAQEYGFSGGLVPGVTISAYLIHPAVTAWGLDWLARGAAHVRIESPLYDRERFQVDIQASGPADYRAELRRPTGTVSARAEVQLPASAPASTVRRGDPIAGPHDPAPVACFDTFAKLQREGCRACCYPWPGQSPMRTYLRDPSQLPTQLQSDRGGYANSGFVLSCANWILESNARMNPWVHLETELQNLQPIAAGTSIVAEMSIVEFFEKKGHEFVDVDVCLYDQQSEACLATIRQRAIYKLRGFK